MKRIVVCSITRGAGKTSVIAGLMKHHQGQAHYLKPLGDRLLYKKKRSIDHDAALLNSLYDLETNPELMTLGFDHSKLRFMYDQEGLRSKLAKMLSTVPSERELIFIEAGTDMVRGSSLGLDPVSLANMLEADILMVGCGEEDHLLDSLTQLKQTLEPSQVENIGLVINHVIDPEEFSEQSLPVIEEMGFKVKGVLPEDPRLMEYTVQFLADSLFCKILAGEEGLANPVKEVFVGAMSANMALVDPDFRHSGKLIITSGDRTDMILAALESDTAGIILTNNILPPPNIISKAAERKVPLLSVTLDTYQLAKQLDDLEPLLTRFDNAKVDLLAQMVKGIELD